MNAALSRLASTGTRVEDADHREPLAARGTRPGRRRGRGCRAVRRPCDPSTTAGSRAVAASRNGRPDRAAHRVEEVGLGRQDADAAGLGRRGWRRCAGPWRRRRVSPLAAVTGPMRRIMAVASGGQRRPPRRGSVCPAWTCSRLVPSASSSARRSALLDAEMPSTATRAAMPMAMPSAVRARAQPAGAEADAARGQDVAGRRRLTGSCGRRSPRRSGVARRVLTRPHAASGSSARGRRGRRAERHDGPVAAAGHRTAGDRRAGSRSGGVRLRCPGRG